MQAEDEWRRGKRRVERQSDDDGGERDGENGEPEGCEQHADPSFYHRLGRTGPGEI